MTPDTREEALCLVTALRRHLEDLQSPHRKELESRLELQGAKPVTISALLRLESELK